MNLATKMTTMNRFHSPFLGLFLLLGGLPWFTSPAQAAESPHASGGDSSATVAGNSDLPLQPGQTKTTIPAPAPLFAGIADNIVGNRTRMIQVAFIAFAIGVFILMTASRKH